MAYDKHEYSEKLGQKLATDFWNNLVQSNQGCFPCFMRGYILTLLQAMIWDQDNYSEEAQKELHDTVTLMFVPPQEKRRGH